jgi:hypothetical protein
LAEAEAGPFPALGSTALQNTPDGCGGTYGAATNPANYPAGGGGDVIFGNGQGFFTEVPSFGFPAGGQWDDRISAYVSDTIKLTAKLAVNIGIRYLRDTGRDDADLPSMPVLDQVQPGLGNGTRQPNLNFGPQGGFAYDLKGNGKTVIRGGAGIYYENNVWNNVLFDRPPKLAKGLFFGTTEPCPGSASFCDQTVGNVYGQIASAQKAYQLSVAAAGPAANGEYIPTLMAVPASYGLFIFSPNYKTPSSYQMNIGVQHELHPGIVLSVDYVRSVGIHALVGIDTNHVGDAQYLNVANATAAINATTTSYSCTTGTMSQQIDCAIAQGAQISNFASNGLDSENQYFFGLPAADGLPGPGAAFPGKNTNWGQVLVLYPTGRSVYNGLDVELQGQMHHVMRGMDDVNMTTSYTYSHYDATGTTSLGDADFGGNGWDNNNPNKYYGPTSLDRHNQFSIGLTMKSFAGIEFNTIAHLYSSLPTNLNLETNASANADIFTDDVDGSGVIGGIVPGTNVGSFGRQYNGSSINRLISQYNATVAGKPSPAGQALINANLFTQTQLSELGGVLKSIQPAPMNQPSNDILRTWDVTLGRTIHIRGERFNVRPTIAIFNILNAVNYNNRTGANGQNVMGGALNGLAGSPNGTAGHTAEYSDRVSAGSGVYAEGSPRQLEYGLKLNF